MIQTVEEILKTRLPSICRKRKIPSVLHILRFCNHRFNQPTMNQKYKKKKKFQKAKLEFPTSATTYIVFDIGSTLEMV